MFDFGREIDFVVKYSRLKIQHLIPGRYSRGFWSLTAAFDYSRGDKLGLIQGEVVL